MDMNYDCDTTTTDGTYAIFEWEALSVQYQDPVTSLNSGNNEHNSTRGAAKAVSERLYRSLGSRDGPGISYPGISYAGFAESGSDKATSSVSDKVADKAANSVADEAAPYSINQARKSIKPSVVLWEDTQAASNLLPMRASGIQTRMQAAQGPGM